MAEFKLGRIRFVWKDEWTTATTYYVDDVVRNGGKTYICRVGHESAGNFYTDLDFVPSKWNVLSDGQEWKADWTTDTFYKENDIVKYGGLLYICNTSHSSAATTLLGLEDDQSNWDLFAEGFDWKDNWTVSTRYKKNDLVKYGGYTYVCNAAHVSSATTTLGLEADQSKWDAFNQGIEYKGAWNGSSTKYKINDVVKQGAKLWICTVNHNSTANFITDSAAYWTAFIDGFQFESEWTDSTTYQPGDIVRYGGNQYVAKTNHVNAVPSTSTANWDLFTEGFNFLADWSEVTAYRPGDVVRLRGYTYLATANNTNQEPPNLTYWERLNSGIQWQGEWTDDVEYKLGDAVRYVANTYICILGHRSEGDDGSTIGPEGGGAANSRPDQDVAGTYWNLLSIGTETAVLIERGDLVYYGGAGPTRLPVGKEGQVLVAGAQDPEWRTLGEIDDVYFVANHGTDNPSPTWGKTFDQPFKTIRYACEQVEKGAKNPNAQLLLELNRVFIQREVTSWIDYQIANATVGSIWEDFDYDEHKCERDTGFLVDRLIWDIGHGGNLKMRAAAQTYLNLLSEGPFSNEDDENGTGVYTKLGDEAANDIAAFNYMVSLVDDVLNNQAPAVVYQDVADDSTKIAEQYIDLSLTVESGVVETVTSLVSIVTDALANPTQVGTLPTIPARQVPNTLIRVATGRYRETLPIIVPAYTCVQGDELRSTNAGPAGSLVDIADSLYTVDTFRHIESFIGDIVTGSTVTPTTGNTVSQFTDWPVADIAEASVVTDLISVMKHQSDYRLGTLHVTNLTDPVGYNVSYLIGYGNARSLIKGNKKFLQEEVIAYLIANYPTLKYGKTKARRDAGYIIDAVVYDLTYSGNALSVQAGLAYWDGDTDAQPQIPDSIKTATLASIEFLKTRMQSIAIGASFTPLQTDVARVTGTAGSAGASTLVGDNVDDIIEIITEGPEDAVYTLVDATPADGVNSTTALIADYATLEDGDAFDAIKDAVEAYLAANYSDVDYSVAKARRDTGIVLKAIGYDFMFGSVYQTVKAAHAYLRLTASELFDRDDRIKEATRNALIHAKDQAVAALSGSPTTAATVATLFKIVDDVIYGGSDEGNVCSTELRNRDYAILQLERNREFIVAEVQAYISDTYPAYEYNEALCLRDVNTYIDALKWDLKYTSNYKSRYVARYYANAVLGSFEEDMYYLRDGTGLRDHSLEGLNGDLTPPNAYGTSRPTAGAYASLDPGWGPDDFRTWIVSRSPYVQGLTTFGNGAIGQKIDGALHNGGNDSIVSNDFTQVISDGIGAWVANNGRAELVSVFTYYSHIGYLATEGGRIRGTNGNNSYGDFGSVAEGFDEREVPNTAVVDNKFQFVATIGDVFTDVDQMLALEFENAGIDYTEVNYTLTGGGQGAIADGNEFRDDAVYQVRLTADVEDSTLFVAPAEGQFGGEGYVTNSNTAQGGTSTQITIAATDSELATAYPGMKIFLTGGTGVGQFATIDTYNNGTKVATVLKELNEVAAGSFNISTKYKIVELGSTDFTAISTLTNPRPGQIFTATGVGNGTGRAIELVAGWNHVIPGTTISAPDASTTYTIEPSLLFTAPGYSSVAGTSATAAAYSAIEYFESFVTYLDQTGTPSGSGVNAEFNIIRKGTKYLVFVSAGGTGYEIGDTITVLGSNLGGADTTNDVTLTVTSINTVTGAVLNVDHVGFGAGGNFVALEGGSDNAITSIGGAWTARTLPEIATWTSLASGRLLTPISSGDLVVGQAYTIASLGDSIFTAVGAENNFVGLTFIATGQTGGTGTAYPLTNVAVAIASGTDETAYSVDGGATWTAGGDLPSTTTWTSVAYGDGVWVAVATGGTANAYSEDGGLTWTAGAALPASTDWISITYGAGKFVAVAEGGTDVAYSVNGGATWTAGTGIASSDWKSVTFGNNRFVAVSSTSGTTASYSLDGIAWTASTLPATAVWTDVTYGQGVFLAVSTTTQAATSEDGVLWQSRNIDTSNSSGVAFGNSNRVGKFVTISNTGSSNVSIVSAGARTRARSSVANGQIFQIRITEPGSGYSTTPLMYITDPNNTFEAPFTVRKGKGVLANPTFVNRGSGYVTGSAEVQSGDGYADNYQPGSFIAIRRISQRPVPGSNVIFGNLPDRTFKLVNVITFLGENDGSYTAFLQISPALTVSETPEHLETVTTRLRYSQVRLTGHDFLDIGTGNFANTNYPGTPVIEANPATETVENNGGRVFFTATDQDGNFRVGDLFSIEQSTGIATLNADAFNISGLQELNLGNVTLGGGSATVTEFSTDPFFTADSDNIVPTQRAIKAFIASQIGGGGASLNVNSITAGAIFISGQTLTTVTGIPIKMNATFDFRGGVTGTPLAFNFFLN